jgi:glutathione S-transferase
MLKLYYHPLASFCWKVLIPLYENATPFEGAVVDLGDAGSRDTFARVWPLAKFPVIVDGAREATVGEATTIIEYLDAFHPGSVRLVPQDADAAWRVKMWDRVLDHHIHEPMQKIVVDRLRPEGGSDVIGVDQARETIRGGYAFLETQISDGPWFMGEDFTMADCAAAPALFYANAVEPLERDSKLRAYLGRLMGRPSFARVLVEAEPFFGWFPYPAKLGREL